MADNPLPQQIINAEPDSSPSDQIEESAIKILKIVPTKRTPKELAVLMKFTENIAFIKNTADKLGTQAHFKLCQNLLYKFLPNKSVVFEAGSVGTTFFIILKGSVSIHIRVPVTNHDGVQVMGSKKVADLTAGKSFGELSIMDETLKPRSATIICTDDCHFALLDRKPYQAILGDADKELLQQQYDFLRSNAYFRDFPEYMLKSWTYLFEKKATFPWKHVIYKEGEKPKEIYLIKSGQVICTKKMAIPQKFEERNVLTLNNDKKSIILEEKEKVYKEVKITLLGPGQLFGEEEAFAEFRRNKERDIDNQKDERIKSALQYLGKGSEEEKILSSISLLRETTVTVDTTSAEIWCVPAKFFFPKLMIDRVAFENGVSIILNKRILQSERIAATQKEQSTYIGFVAKQKPTLGYKRSLTRMQRTKYTQENHRHTHSQLSHNDPSPKPPTTTTEPQQTNPFERLKWNLKSNKSIEKPSPDSSFMLTAMPRAQSPTESKATERSPSTLPGLIRLKKILNNYTEQKGEASPGPRIGEYSPNKSFEKAAATALRRIQTEANNETTEMTEKERLTAETMRMEKYLRMNYSFTLKTETMGGKSGLTKTGYMAPYKRPGITRISNAKLPNKKPENGESTYREALKMKEELQKKINHIAFGDSMEKLVKRKHWSDGESFIELGKIEGMLKFTREMKNINKSPRKLTVDETCRSGNNLSLLDRMKKKQEAAASEQGFASTTVDTEDLAQMDRIDTEEMGLGEREQRFISAYGEGINQSSSKGIVNRTMSSFHRMETSENNRSMTEVSQVDSSVNTLREKRKLTKYSTGGSFSKFNFGEDPSSKSRTNRIPSIDDIIDVPRPLPRIPSLNGGNPEYRKIKVMPKRRRSRGSNLSWSEVKEEGLNVSNSGVAIGNKSFEKMGDFGNKGRDKKKLAAEKEKVLNDILESFYNQKKLEVFE